MNIVGDILVAIIALFSISGAGLDKNLSKIHTRFATAIFILVFLAFIYHLFNNFYLIFEVPYYVVIAFAPLYVVLWVVQLLKNHRKANNKSELK